MIDGPAGPVPRAPLPGATPISSGEDWSAGYALAPEELRRTVFALRVGPELVDLPRPTPGRG